MSVILDIDLDYFGLFEHPMQEFDRILGWAARPVDFVVEYHHEAYLHWNKMVKNRVISLPQFIIHVDEHHDMLSDKPPVNFGSFVYFAMRRWPDCRVYWMTPEPIDYPDMWLSEAAWDSVSARFECGSSIGRHWPKPDLVSICTSLEFIDQQLCKRLLERIGDLRR